MKWLNTRWRFGCIIGLLATLFLASGISVAIMRDRRVAIDMPVSVGIGTIRTREFPVKNETYLIMLRAEKRLPFADMMCMLGLTTGPLSRYNCDKEPLLQADWTVWGDGLVVARGSVHGRNGKGGWASDSIDRYLGEFRGESKRKYMLEVKFTHDGTPLNVTKPRLIVTIIKPGDLLP